MKTFKQFAAEAATQRYEMMHRNGQVKKFIAKDDADAKRIAAGHGAKSVIKLKASGASSKLAEQDVAEGLSQTLRKVVPGYAKREIDKKMDAGKFGKTDADKDANFQRYKKIQDKLKEQVVAEEGMVAGNAVGAGNVQGIGFGAKGEPGGRKAIMNKMLKRKMPNVVAKVPT